MYLTFVDKLIALMTEAARLSGFEPTDNDVWNRGKYRPERWYAGRDLYFAQRDGDVALAIRSMIRVLTVEGCAGMFRDICEDHDMSAFWDLIDPTFTLYLACINAGGHSDGFKPARYGTAPTSTCGTSTVPGAEEAVIRFEGIGSAAIFALFGIDQPDHSKNPRVVDARVTIYRNRWVATAGAGSDGIIVADIHIEKYGGCEIEMSRRGTFRRVYRS